MDIERKAPSLVNLCMRIAINNLRYIRNVAAVPAEILDRILYHCTLEQLAQIEDATKGRDLSPVTDKLWKQFYEQRFGAEKTFSVIRNMEKKGVQFRWRALYDASLKSEDALLDTRVKKLKNSYLKQQEIKKSRQIRICSKEPPTKKRFFGDSSSSLTSYHNPMMKRAKIETLNSSKLKMHTDVRKSSFTGNGISLKRSFPGQQATTVSGDIQGACQIKKLVRNESPALEFQERPRIDVLTGRRGDDTQKYKRL